MTRKLKEKKLFVDKFQIIFEKFHSIRSLQSCLLTTTAGSRGGSHKFINIFLLNNIIVLITESNDNQVVLGGGIFERLREDLCHSGGRFDCLIITCEDYRKFTF